jgi:hypothetical protein
MAPPQSPNDDNPRRPGWNPFESPQSRATRRRAKIVAEIERNRRGDYTVPTWALALILIVLVGGFAALVVFS